MLIYSWVYVSVEIYNHTHIYKCIGIITHVFSTIFLLKKLILFGIPNQLLSHHLTPPPKLIINLLLKEILFPIYVTNSPPLNPNSPSWSISLMRRANNQLPVELSPLDLVMNSRTKIKVWRGLSYRKDLHSMKNPLLINHPSERIDHIADNQAK